MGKSLFPVQSVLLDTAPELQPGDSIKGFSCSSGFLLQHYWSHHGSVKPTGDTVRIITQNNHSCSNLYAAHVYNHHWVNGGSVVTWDSSCYARIPSCVTIHGASTVCLALEVTIAVCIACLRSACRGHSVKVKWLLPPTQGKDKTQRELQDEDGGLWVGYYRINWIMSGVIGKAGIDDRWYDILPLIQSSNSCVQWKKRSKEIIAKRGKERGE